MTYTPNTPNRLSDLYVSPWSYQSLIASTANQFPADALYPTAGLVIFVPFWVPEPTIVTKLWWYNGTAVAGNVDVGIYNEDATRIVSAGTTAAAGTSTTQSVNITDTTIARGAYYMAICCSDATTQRLHAAVPSAGIPQSLGLLQQAGVTLPLSTGASPATFAKYATAYIPLFGLQCYRGVGP